MKSTVPPGTGERVRAWLDARGLTQVGYVSNPEFLAEGTAVANFMRPDRVVVGSFRSEVGDRVALLYKELAAPVVRADVTSAEMIKSASNAFLATKISFINEIANVCEEVGADVTVVAGGMGLDQRIGLISFGPGSGTAALLPQGCRRPETACRQLGLPLSALDVGDRGQRAAGGIAVAAISEVFAIGRSCFSDWHSSPTRTTFATLRASFWHRACSPKGHTSAWDPVAVEDARPHLPGVQLYEDLLEAVSGADAAVIVTEWDELKAFPRPEVRTAMKNPLIVDGRNLLDPEAVRRAGFAQ